MIVAIICFVNTLKREFTNKIKNLFDKMHIGNVKKVPIT